MKNNLAIAYAVKRRAKKMAEGGRPEMGQDSRGDKGYGAIVVKEMAEGGMLTKKGYEAKASGPHQDEFHEAMPMAKLQVKHPEDDVKHNEMAMMEDEEMSPMSEEDMVDHIMKKRMMAEGGEVANDTDPFEYEFEDPNEFDDMVLDDHVERKQPMQSNEHGDEYDANHKDMVSEIMMKRKKQSNPRPA